MKESVGYTSDGKVFLRLVSDYEGKQIQTWKTWSPAEARAVAAAFMGAADLAHKITGGHNGGAKQQEKEEAP